MKRVTEALGALLRFVVLDPVGEGSPQPRRWPWSLRMVGAVVLVLCLAALTHIIAAGAIRGASPMLVVGPDTYLPEMALPLLGAGVFLSLTLMHTAALHVGWPLRLIALVSMAGVVAGAFVQPELPPAMIAATGFILLLFLHVARIGRPYAPVELVLVGLIVFTITQAPLLWPSRAAVLGYDMRGFVIGSQLDQLNLLAVPALVMAGTALTQLGVTVGEGAVKVAARRLPHDLLLAGFMVLLALVTWLVLRQVAGELPSTLVPQLVWSLVILAGAVLVTVPFVRRARRGPAAPGELEPGALADRFGATWFLVAAGSMLFFLLPIAMITINAALRWHEIAIPAWTAAIEALANNPWSNSGSRAAVAVIGLAVAWRQARRGTWLLAALLAGFLMPSLTWLVAQFLPSAQWAHATTTRDLWLLVAILVTALRLVARNQLHGARLVALLTAVVIMAVHPLRAFISDPISHLLGSIAVAALVFGLVWRVLTEGSFTRNSSRGLPQPARILLFLANALFAFTALARAALTRATGGMMDPAMWEWLGDARFAEPLYLAAILVPVAVAWFSPSWFAMPPPAPMHRLGQPLRA